MRASRVMVAMAVSAVSLGAQQPDKRGTLVPPASVTGRVVGPDLQGLADADVLLRDDLRTSSDRKGYFAFDPAPAGVFDVLVRKIGFVPVRFTLVIMPGDVWDGTIPIAPSTQLLPEVVVLDSTKSLRNYRPYWIDGFVNRRRIGVGTFFDHMDIERSHVMRVAQLIARVPGIHLRETTGFDQLTTARCVGGSPSMGVLWIDDVKMESTSSGRFSVLGDFQPEALAGAEVYVGRGSIPPQYDQPQACLVIVLWTTRR